MAYLYDGISLQNRRSVNMDSLLLKSRTIRQMEVCLAAVCDGVGSLADGAFAAGAAVRMLSNWFENLEETEGLGAMLRDYVADMNLAIVARARTMEMKTASTLSCLLLADDQYWIIHVGDSRIYLWVSGAVHQLTRDHSRAGRLTSALGYRREMEIFFVQGQRKRGEGFLLCSDGLYKRMDLNVLARNLGQPRPEKLKSRLTWMTDYVIRQGETDNITAALLIKEER